MMAVSSPLAVHTLVPPCSDEIPDSVAVIAGIASVMAGSDASWHAYRVSLSDFSSIKGFRVFFMSGNVRIRHVAQRMT